MLRLVALMFNDGLASSFAKKETVAGFLLCEPAPCMRLSTCIAVSLDRRVFGEYVTTDEELHQLPNEVPKIVVHFQLDLVM